MKQNKRKYIGAILLGFLMLTIGFTGGAVWAANQNIRIIINGKDIACDPAPFIKEGRVFVPLRAVSEALGEPVKWDEATQSVQIGTTPEGFDLVSDLKPYLNEETKIFTPISICGIKYSYGYNIPAKGPIWNLGGNYSKLTFTAGRGDDKYDQTWDAVMCIEADGNEIAKIKQPPNTAPVDYTIDVTGVKVLQIKNNTDGVGVVHNACILNPRVQ